MPGAAPTPSYWPSARRHSLRDVSEQCGQVLWARPHGPVTRRQVEVRDVAQLGKTGDPWVACFDSGFDLVGLIELQTTVLGTSSRRSSVKS